MLVLTVLGKIFICKSYLGLQKIRILIYKNMQEYLFAIKMVNGKFMIFKMNSTSTEALIYQIIKLLLYSMKLEHEVLI
jgi:hypothetical protein